MLSKAAASEMLGGNEEDLAHLPDDKGMYAHVLESI